MIDLYVKYEPFSRSSERNNGVSISKRYKRFNRLTAIEFRFCDFKNVVKRRRVGENCLKQKQSFGF